MDLYFIAFEPQDITFPATVRSAVGAAGRSPGYFNCFVKTFLLRICRFYCKKVSDNKKINDFEEGLEYFAVVESSCTCIISEDTGDFYFADIEVLTAEDFCMKYMVRLRT